MLYIEVMSSTSTCKYYSTAISNFAFTIQKSELNSTHQPIYLHFSDIYCSDKLLKFKINN